MLADEFRKVFLNYISSPTTDNLAKINKLIDKLEGLSPKVPGIQYTGMGSVKLWYYPTNEEVALVERGDFISAIKAIRERTGQGLLESKNAAEALRDHLKALKE